MSYVNAPIHDLLIRIKNSYMARRKSLDGIVYSQFKENVLTLLKKYKFIESFNVVSVDNKKFIQISLYFSGSMREDIPVIKFYSTPSRKRYVASKDLKLVAAGK
jgi:small subunit ribosomal protein S8